MIHESRGWVCFSSRTVPSAWHRAQHTLGVWSVIQGAGLSPSLAGRMALLKSLCNRCAAAVAKGKLIWCISPVCLFSCYTCARWLGDRVVRDSRGKGTSWAQQAPWSRPLGEESSPRFRRASTACRQVSGCGAECGQRLHPSYILRQRREGTHRICVSVASFLVLVSDQRERLVGVTFVSSLQLTALPP